jgi:hypothetical protein
MEIDEFVKFCEKKRCPRHSFVTKNCLKKSKQDTCYQKFISKVKEVKVDEELKNTYDIVLKRDKGKCRLLAILTKDELSLIVEPLGTIDNAHIFGKGAYPHLKYDHENIILLHRLFHSRLDTGRDPITGKPSDALHKEYWWMRVLGKEKYDKLLKKARKL